MTSRYRRDPNALGGPDAVECAAALSYCPRTKQAPRIAFTGQKLVAKEMIAIARRYGIKVETDSRLAQQLSALEVDQAIPPDLYDDVARLLLELGLAD